MITEPNWFLKTKATPPGLVDQLVLPVPLSTVALKV